MNFDDLLAGHNSAFSVFEEDVWIIYRPKGGKPRSIRAIIDRDPPTPVNSASPVGRATPVSYTLMISVQNHPTLGIDINELNVQVDTVDVPLVLGGKLENKTFVPEKIQHDGGRISLKVK